MLKLGFLLVFLSIGLINCEHFDHVKGGHLKGPSFWSSYKAKVVELPSPTIEHIAPIQQRLIVEEKTHHEPIQERLVVKEKIHTVEPKVVEEVKVVEHHPQVIEQVKVVEHHPKVIEQIRVEEAVKGVRQHHHHHENVVLHDERRHEELHQQREQREQLKEIQHFQQIQQHEQIRQQLEQQRNLEQVVQKKVVEVSAPIVEGKTVQHIEQIVQQKQQRNEKLTDEEEAVAEPFPLIPKTSFSCDDKPVLPGMYADIETGCRVYHFCFAKQQKADIVEQVHQDKLHQIDALHADVHHQNSLLVHHLPQPEQQQMKSFFCGQGTLFNQRLLICDHEVNVICSESIHFYSANLEFGKPSAEPAARLVQQREISKTNIVQFREPEPIVQVREKIIQQPIVQVKEQVVLQPEPIKIVQHHDAIKIVEPPRHIVQVREPVVQVREQIVQHPVKTVQHVESAPIKSLPPLSPVKIGHLIEQPVIVEQRKNLHTTTNKIVHEDRVVTSTHTDTDAGSFASSSELHPNWREDNSWKTSRTIWGNSINNETSETNNNEGENRLRESAEWAPAINRNENNNSNDSFKKLEEKPKTLGRRFLGELMTTNIPNTSFSCEGKPFDGFYADPLHNCTIYHQCFNGKRSTYKCRKGTLFDQATLSCNFEEKVKCSESEKFYTTNIEFN